MAGTETGSVYVETYGTSSPVTGSAPTVVTDGQALDGLYAITVVVSVATGVTLSGAGSLLCYCYDASVGRWFRVPQFDILTATATVRDLGFQAFETATPRKGRVKWVPSAVDFSAGSAGVTVTQLGQTNIGLVKAERL